MPGIYTIACLRHVMCNYKMMAMVIFTKLTVLAFSLLHSFCIWKLTWGGDKLQHALVISCNAILHCWVDSFMYNGSYITLGSDSMTRTGVTCTSESGMHIEELREVFQFTYLNIRVFPSIDWHRLIAQRANWYSGILHYNNWLQKVHV